MPVNCLPSMHVCMSFVAAACLSLVYGRVGRALVWAWFVAICYSTMATKQHYFVDLIAGFALGVTSVAIYMKRYNLLPDFSDLLSSGGSGTPFGMSTDRGSSRPMPARARMRLRAVVSKLRKRS